jgi:hypothetical protein
MSHKALARVKAIVGGIDITPRLTPNPRDRGKPELRALAGTIANRFEVVATGFPDDDGMSGVKNRRRLLEGAVEVFYGYQTRGAEGLEHRLIIVAEKVTDALGDPNNWKFDQSGIDLIEPERADTEIVGEESGVILIIPFTLRYYPR